MKKNDRDIYNLRLYWEACELAKYQNFNDYEEYKNAIEEIYSTLLEKNHK